MLENAFYYINKFNMEENHTVSVLYSEELDAKYTYDLAHISILAEF